MCAEEGEKDGELPFPQDAELTGGRGVARLGRKEKGAARRQSGPEDVCCYVCMQFVCAFSLWMNDRGRRPHSRVEAGQESHRDSDGVLSPIPSRCYIACVWFPTVEQV